MTCPACGRRDTEVLETRRAWTGTDVFRRHRCQCGVRWESAQRLMAGTLSTAGSLPVATGSLPAEARSSDAALSTTRSLPVVAKPPPSTTGSPSSSDGGVGGGLPSDPDRIPRSGSDPVPLVVRSEKKVKVMGPPAYTPVFEAIWQASDKCGSKADAFRAWVQVGSPAPGEIVPARTLWLAWWNGIGVKHMATWLRAYDWQQEPEPRQQGLALRPPAAAPEARNWKQEATDIAFRVARASRPGGEP